MMGVTSEPGVANQPPIGAKSQPVFHPGRESAFWSRCLTLLALCALVAVLASNSAVQESLGELLDTVRPVMQRHAVAGGLLLIGLAAISAMVAFASIGVLVPAAVFAWGEPAVIMLLWLGWILGGVLAYTLAWHLGQRVTRWVGARSLLERCENLVGADVPFALILMLQLALPSEIPGYLLGLIRYPARKYMAALALAELPYAVITVYLGNAFLEQRSGTILGVGTMGAVLSLVVACYLRRATRVRGN